MTSRREVALACMLHFGFVLCLRGVAFLTSGEEHDFGSAGSPGDHTMAWCYTAESSSQGALQSRSNPGNKVLIL
ncbi:hypothetical protein Y1Q_0023473 [Alligator mississippiensis]|uniref:Secreted protein n=1 Tax=Alligator mississippiensis TaxID=8496 RepID=A0A151NQM8_ALLMI|nr:hypothetical protein Y1Q_0023473 [Alligator mississippiensis]